MSTTEQEREIEIVAGVIEGVIQKKPDTWQVAVKPDGSQYDRKLWTKDAELVQSLTAKLGQHGAFVCGASYWTNQSGTQVRSLWINGMSEDGDGHQSAEERVAAPDTASRPAAPQKAAQSDGGMTKEEWARKDSAIHMMAAIKAAADALKHTLPSEPSDKDLRDYVERVKFLSYNWWQRADAVRKGDDSDVPFPSEHDDAIPY